MLKKGKLYILKITDPQYISLIHHIQGLGLLNKPFIFLGEKPNNKLIFKVLNGNGEIVEFFNSLVIDYHEFTIGNNHVSNWKII